MYEDPENNFSQTQDFSDNIETKCIKTLFISSTVSLETRIMSFMEIIMKT